MLKKAEKTKELQNAYRGIDLSNQIEKMDNVLIDYFGAAGGASTEIPDLIRKRTFQSVNELAQIVGDGVLPREIIETSGQGSKLQHLKDRHLGLTSTYDFFRHIIVVLKDLDPSSNGFVTNQELEDCFKAIYPE